MGQNQQEKINLEIWYQLIKANLIQQQIKNESIQKFNQLYKILRTSM
jgi:hypothetical protein